MIDFFCFLKKYKNVYDKEKIGGEESLEKD